MSAFERQMEWLAVLDKNRRTRLAPMQLHTERQPHWSVGIEWRPGRWDPLINAPRQGHPVLHVRGITKEGNIIPDMHYAHGDGDGMMPPFIGWFAPRGNGFTEVKPVAWQPIGAMPYDLEGKRDEI